MEDDACTGCPSTIIGNTSIAIMSTLLNEDRGVTVWEMEGGQVYQKNTIHHILIEYLTKKKVAVLWVPHLLFPVQKQHHMELGQKHVGRSVSITVKIEIQIVVKGCPHLHTNTYETNCCMNVRYAWKCRYTSKFLHLPLIAYVRMQM